MSESCWGKTVGDMDAGNPPAQFDDGAMETGGLAAYTHGAPTLNSTGIRERKRSVCAVVTTYFPDRVAIRAVERTRKECDAVVIIDNTPSCSSPSYMNQEDFNNTPGAPVHVIRMGYNSGVATALNLGVRWASAQSFEYVLLLDQDSMPCDSSVSKLLNAHISLEGQGIPVGCTVGTTQQEGQSRLMPILVGYCKRRGGLSHGNFQEVFLARSAGTLIRTETFLKCGGLRDKFFIASVDHEFCFRLREAGLKVIMVRDAFLVHPWNHTITIGFLGIEIQLESHQPSRYYYIARNSINTFRLHYRLMPLDSLLYLVYSMSRIGVEFALSPSLALVSRHVVTGIIEGLSSKVERDTTPHCDT